MEFDKIIEKRRSIRNYDKTKTVTKEDLEKLIYAAIQAPSWKNSQTARYYCVVSKEKVEKFRNECLPEFNATRCDGVGAFIVATFVKNIAGFNTETGEKTNELGNGWGIYDLGLHNENLLLKAVDLGLDTLVMGIRNTDKITEMLNIPESECIVSVIAVGYAAKEAVKPNRKQVAEIAKFF